jgi:hypothetical protein
MQSREDAVYDTERGRPPTSGSNPSPPREVPLRTADEVHKETEAYTAEEEALVEERLKNLGYL